MMVKPEWKRARRNSIVGKIIKLTLALGHEKLKARPVVLEYSLD